MKVLHVLYSGLGGHGNVFFSMIDADRHKDIEFEALFNGVEEVKKEYIEHCRERNIKWSFVKKSPGLDIGYFYRLYKHIKQARPDIIFLHGGAAALPAWFVRFTGGFKTRIIVRETQANHLKTTIDWIYLVLAMLVADKMVYLSEEYKAQVKEKLKLLYSEKKTVVIPNGINLSTFRTASDQPGHAQIVLGMQSRLIPIKDHLTLLDAFALVQKKPLPLPVQLRIAGDGEFKETLVRHAAEIGVADQVVFTGMLEEPELVSFLQNVDIYIHASLGETMSTAVMQAMACGKPVIASDVPGINNMIINNNTGVLVPVKDPVALANAIIQLINDPALAEKLAANAFNFAVAKYSNTRMLENYKAIFAN